MTFEATPDYLFHPLAASRAHDLLPDAHIIVLLRNPIDRAWSHYHHRLRLGLESLDFDEAIRSEEDRIAKERKASPLDPNLYGRELLFSSYQSRSYVSRGLYADQLERWFESYDRDRFLILLSEDLFSDTASSYRQILRFLDLPEEPLPRFDNHSYRQSRRPDMGGMTEESRLHLAELFAPHNARLEALLGVDLRWDKLART